ncbi:hypothetical protein [Cerasicoccus maritimus]|uniref:hypothetical protein n=1 Tax=Cerasicoccus maritimus TaxID=490089 RepID=UPI002852CF6C|nr:hypothetical protein [Cerasicoccus maritimus]
MNSLTTLCASLALIGTTAFATPEGHWLDLQLEQMALETQYREQHEKMQACRLELAAVHQQLDKPDFQAYAEHASERLLELRLSEVDQLQKYRVSHPDLQLTQRQIRFLESIPGTHLDPQAMQSKLLELQAKKAALEVRYRDQHPALLSHQAKIDYLQTKLDQQRSTQL